MKYACSTQQTMQFAGKLGMALRASQKSALFAIVILSLILSSITPPQTVQAGAPNRIVGAATTDFVSAVTTTGYWDSFIREIGKIFSNLLPTISHQPVRSKSVASTPNTVQSQNGVLVKSGKISRASELVNGTWTLMTDTLTPGKAYTIMAWGSYVVAFLDLGGTRENRNVESVRFRDADNNPLWLARSYQYPTGNTRPNPDVNDPPEFVDMVATWECVADATGTIKIGVTGGGAPITGAIYYRIYEKALPEDQNLSPSGECFCNAASAKYWVGKGIDAKTGHYSYQTTDLQVAGTLLGLKFERSYSSTLRDIDRGMGMGWRHNYDIQLILNPGEAIVQMGDGSRLRFSQLITYPANAPNTPQYIDFYMAPAGVAADLKHVNTKYELKTVEGILYTFNTSGLLEKIKDTSNHSLSLTYTNGKLSRVTDDASHKLIKLTYKTGTALIETVESFEQIGANEISSGYKVQFTYTHDAISTNPDIFIDRLATVTDPNLKEWTYSYEDTNPKLLTKVQDPLERILVQTEFDTNGRAIKQYDGAGTLAAQIVYNSDHSLVSDASGRTTKVSFDGRNTLSQLELPDGSIEQRSAGGNYRLKEITDGNGATTQVDWEANCMSPARVTDAIGGQTRVGRTSPTYPSYIDGNPTGVVDAVGRATTFEYIGKLLQSKTNALGQTTIYSYTSASFGLPSGLLQSVTDPTGSKTEYVYTPTGQITQTIRNSNLPQAQRQTTIYTYYGDGSGRLKTLQSQNGTGPIEHTAWFCYDAVGHIIRQIERNGTLTDSETPCNTQSFIPQTGDQIRSSIYDDAGNQIATIDPDGVITRTYYDSLNRPEFVVRNLFGQQIEAETPPGDALRSVEQNLTTQTVYDAAGLSIATIQLFKGCIVTAGQDGNGKPTLAPNASCLVNRTWYDALKRPFRQVQNWQGANLLDEESLPTPLANQPDRNLRNETVYDAAGNAIAAIKVLPNCEVTRTTDVTGKLIAVTVNQYCIVDRTYYDKLNRPEFVVRNLTGRSILQEVSWNAQSHQPDLQEPDLQYLQRTADQNLTTQTVYDGVGQVLATIQILPGCTVTRRVNAAQHATYTTNSNCLVNRTWYDALGRVNASVQNLSDQAVDDVFTAPPAYNPNDPDKNVLASQTVFDAGGRNIASVDPLQHVTRTWYDDLNRPVAVTRNLKNPAQPTANPTEILAALTTFPEYTPNQPDWNVTSQTRYDADGRVIASIDPQKRVTRTWYDAQGRAIRVIQNLRDPNNDDTSINGLINLTPIPAYDPAYPDQNISRETVYDAQGRAIATISASSAGCVVTRAANGTVSVTDACIVERSYFDAIGRVYVTIRNLKGQTIAHPYPPTSGRTEQANLPAYTIYDERGQVIATTTPHKDCVVARTPDANNLIAYTVGPNCTLNRSYYDGLGRVVTTVQSLIGQDYTVPTPPARNTNLPNQNVRSDTRYDASGQRIESVDPKGSVTRFEYDRQGRLTAVTENYLGGATPTHQVNVRTIYTYTAQGQLATIQNAKAVQGSQAQFTTFQYDRLGRLLSKLDPLGHGDTYTYDILGNRVSQTDALGRTTLFSYDALHQQKKIDYPDDPDVTFQYNANGQRTHMTDGVGTTIWAYDGAGRLQSVTDPANQVVNYVYNGLGARTRLTYPDQKMVQYGYTPLGELETVTDWNNTVTRYQTIYTPDGGWQRLATLPNGSATQAEYTALGRLNKLTHTTLAFVVGYGYGYDPNGNRLWAEETFAYRQMLPMVITDGAGGSFLTAPNPGGSTATPAPQNAPGRSATPAPTLLAYPAPAPQSAPRGNLVPTPTVPAYPVPVSQVEPQKSFWQQVVDFLFGDHTPTVSAHSATSANAIPGAPGAVRIDYVYDPLNRLTAANYNNGSYFHYEYDANGSRTREITPTSNIVSEYDAAARLTKVGNVDYTWDANGNLLNDGLLNYTYDNANRLKTAIGGGTSATYTYNGLGERLSQTVNGATTSYTLDLSGSLSQVLQTNTQTYLYGDARLAQSGASGMEYFLPDAQGSVRQIVAANGTLLLNQSYTPYGKVLNGQSTTPSIYGFDGEQTDSTGLQYLRARYYAPATGSFISKDTWEGDPSAPMSYVPWLFGYANPVNYADPTGKSSCYNPLHSLPASCQVGLQYVFGFAATLKTMVTSGALEPVEALATFADLSASQFSEDFPGMLWAMTLVLNDFDANKGMVWTQVNELRLGGAANSPYFIRQNWLQYKNNPSYNKTGSKSWVHSLRGDWNKQYWDKTANQAYHFWFYVAVSYFDGGNWASIANIAHDGSGQENYDFISSAENEAPPPSGISKPDYDLGIQGIILGSKLVKEDIWETKDDNCNSHILGSFQNRTNLGSWIRSNLKG